MKEEPSYYAMIGTDKNIIPYRPELRKIAGTINATILLQQMIYYCSGSKDNKFYKFRLPCTHENYRDGDSWVEKLGFSPDEFDSALSKIAFKLGNCKNKLNKEEALVYYYTDKQRYTWYSLNTELLEKQLSSIYCEKVESPITVKTEKAQLLSNLENPDYLVIGESQITKKMGKPKLPCNLENPNYPIIGESPITIHTEINYKEEIHKEVVADFEKNEKEDSEKPAETFFKKELQEVKEYFSESSEKINLPVETENKVAVENLPDFENQSKEIEVFSKENKMPAKKSKEIFFSETNYFSDAELFSQDLLKRFPHYEKYDLQQYHTSAVNWGQGKPIAKYKKSDWILTVKTWIDCDIKKGVATLKWQTKPLQSQKINSMGDMLDQEQRVTEFLIMRERQKQQEKQANGTNGTYTPSYELIY